MLPLGAFDEFNCCLLQVLDIKLFNDFQITIKTVAIAQEEFVLYFKIQNVRRFNLYRL